MTSLLFFLTLVHLTRLVFWFVKRSGEAASESSGKLNVLSPGHVWWEGIHWFLLCSPQTADSRQTDGRQSDNLLRGPSSFSSLPVVWPSPSEQRVSAPFNWPKLSGRCGHTVATATGSLCAFMRFSVFCVYYNPCRMQGKIGLQWQDDWLKRFIHFLD